jgi:hypothetical protein
MGKRRSQCDLPLVLEQPDGVSERRQVRVESPGFRIRRRALGAGLADMTGTVGCRGR